MRLPLGGLLSQSGRAAVLRQHMWPIRGQRPQRWQESPPEDPKRSSSGASPPARSRSRSPSTSARRSTNSRANQKPQSGDEPAADRSGFASSRLCRAGEDWTAY